MKSFKEYLKETAENTSWSDEQGNKLTLQDIEKATQNQPPEMVPVSDIAHLNLMNRVDKKRREEMEERIKHVTLDRPIIMYNDKILDGSHRLAKAAAEGVSHISVIRVDARTHPLISTIFGK